MTGLFLSFDGIDGSGKSTQIELLSQWLSSRGHDVQVVRDPGGTPLGEALREILLHRQEIPLDITAEMMLYMASRAQLVAELIHPALMRGTTVIADRFLLANVVYQGCGGGLDTKAIWNVGSIATRGLQPTHTFILDLEPSLAIERMRSMKPDRLESRGIEYMTRVRDGFREQSQRLGNRVSIIDASRVVTEIQADIEHIVATIDKQK